jgi:hypothetical protein
MVEEGITTILHTRKGAMLVAITPDPTYPHEARFATYLTNGQKLTCLSMSASVTARTAYETERSFYRSELSHKLAGQAYICY